MNQKDEIIQLRKNGLSYKKISNLLNVSVNSVKSICRRDGITKTKEFDGGKQCQSCGKELIQKLGKKSKKFCSDMCRMKWWNSHLSQVNRKAYYGYQCKNCQRSFTVYGQSSRQFCSHACYIAYRFGDAHE